MEEKTFVVTDEQGNEILYEIVLTFKSPETGKDYVVYKLPEDDEDVMAAVYEELENGEGNLLEIESEEEFQMIQNVLDSFVDENE